MKTEVIYEIKEIIRPHQTVIAKRAKLRFWKLSSFLMKTFVAIYTDLYNRGTPGKEPGFAIYHSIDFSKKETDVAVAVPVEDDTDAPDGFEKIFLPATRAIATVYFGPYEDTQPAYAALDKYLEKEGMEKELVIEEYVTDPRLEKDRSKWKTTIYYTLK